MKSVAIEFTYTTDIIEVPDLIADNIRSIQQRFDQWIYDKSNDHDCWIIEDGKKTAVCFGTSDFVKFINQYELQDQSEKARITREGLPSLPVGMCSIWF